MHLSQIPHLQYCSKYNHTQRKAHHNTNHRKHPQKYTLQMHSQINPNKQYTTNHKKRISCHHIINNQIKYRLRKYQYIHLIFIITFIIIIFFYYFLYFLSKYFEFLLLIFEIIELAFVSGVIYL